MKKVAILGIEKNVKNYVAALTETGMDPVVTLDPAEAAKCDGLLLPGGGDIDPALYNAENDGSTDIDRPLDEVQMAAAKLFIQAGKPILGICKGHQIINVCFGGGMIQDLAVAAGHRYVETDSVHLVGAFPGSVLEKLYGSRFAVNSSHHQGLGAIGRGLRVTASAPDGTVEAIEHGELPILGVQFHPERMCFAKARPDTVNGAAIFEYFKGLL